MQRRGSRTASSPDSDQVANGSAVAATQRGQMVSAALRRGADLAHAAAGAVLEQQLAAEGVTKCQWDQAIGKAADHPRLHAITRPAVLRLDGHEGSIHRYASVPTTLKSSSMADQLGLPIRLHVHL